jgi:hypothetical protein
VIGVLFIAGASLIHLGLKHKKEKQLMIGLFLNLCFVTSVINVIIPKAEQYTQGAAIAFYQTCAEHDCYVETHAFKSYAYIFYSKREPKHFQNREQQKFIKDQLDLMVTEGHSRIKSFSTANQLWLEHGIVDKPAYVVVKIDHEKDLLKLPDAHKLYDLNGYSFFVRMPAKSDK